MSASGVEPSLVILQCCLSRGGKIKTDKNKVTSHAAFLPKHVPGRKRKQPSALIPSSFHVAEERHVASLQPFRTNAAGCWSLGDSGQCLNDPKLPSFLFLIYFFFFFFLQCHLCTTTTKKKKNRSLKKNHGSKLRIQEEKKVDRIRERITCLSPPAPHPSVRHPSMRNGGGWRPPAGCCSPTCSCGNQREETRSGVGLAGETMRCESFRHVIGRRTRRSVPFTSLSEEVVVVVDRPHGMKTHGETWRNVGPQTAAEGYAHAALCSSPAPVERPMLRLTLLPLFLAAAAALLAILETQADGVSSLLRPEGDLCDVTAAAC